VVALLAGAEDVDVREEGIRRQGEGGDKQE
jgi:hypothetical protein